MTDNLVKLLLPLSKRDDLSFEEFRDYYFSNHAPIGMEIPHVVRYTVSLAVNPGGAPYDAVAEMYFESEEDMNRAMGSDALMRAIKDVPNFADPNEGFQMMVEEHVQKDETE